MRALLYTADFSLRCLMRQKIKNLSIMGLFALIVFVFTGIEFMADTVHRQTVKAVEYQPALIVQNLRAGRQVPISLSQVGAVSAIFGVASVRGRVWGYYFDPYTGANYTVVGDPGDLVEDWDLLLEQRSVNESADDRPHSPGRGGAFVGEGILRARRLRVGGVLNFRDFAGRPVSFRVENVFTSNVSLWTHDMIVISEADARALFGLAHNEAWDLAVDVPNEFEVPKVGEKIINMIPGARVIASNQLKRTYGSSFGFRSGVLLSTGLMSLLAFLILAYDRVARLSQEERKEIAVLKAVGWRTVDLIRLNMLQGVILSLTGFLLGAVGSYIHVFLVGAPLLRIIFSGWSVLYPPHPLPPYLDLSKLFGLMFLTVTPYVAVGIVPVWRSAVMDPEEVFRS